MPLMIAVMGATGRTGGSITEALLNAGQKVRALGRSDVKLAALKHAGAETYKGDSADAAFLAEAFRGVDAVYTLQTTDPASPDCLAEDDRKGEAAVRAIRDCGVRYVVALSSLGAGLDEGAGLVSNWYAQEQRLQKIEGINLLLLRPGLFFDNFYGWVELIKSRGIVMDTIAPDLPLPWVSTRDIADAAAKALLARDWTGVLVRELLGPRDMTYSEATRIIGKWIGMPGLRYVQCSYAEHTEAMLQAGTSPNFASLYMDMMRIVNDGRLITRAGRTPENTTPTRLEDFAREFARTIGAI
jgi:uncharacterized protein YbjT (DUF2867 family)